MKRVVVCHFFRDRGWDDPRMTGPGIVHVDLSKYPGNGVWNDADVWQWVGENPDMAVGDTVQVWGYRKRLADGPEPAEGHARAYLMPQPYDLERTWDVYHCPEFLRAAYAIFPGLNEFMKSETRMAYGSMFELRKADFDRFAAFMLRARKAAEPLLSMDFRVGGVPIQSDRYQRRQPAFLMERLAAFWLQRLSGLAVDEAALLETGEASPAQRARRSCVVAIQCDERNLEEWARWHLGPARFDSVFVFNDMCSPWKVPEDLRGRVFQEPAKWESGGMGKQFTSYNSWLWSEAAKAYSVAAFVDLDEYVNLHGMAPDEWVASKGSPVASLNWVFYGSRLSEGPANSLLARFRDRAKTPDRHLKPVIDLDVVRKAGISPFFLNPHCVHYRDPRGGQGIMKAATEEGFSAGPFCEAGWDPAERPYVAHYYSKTEEEFSAKIARGRCDALRQSKEQYWLQREKMWEIRRQCDRNEVRDEEMARAAGLLR